MVGSHVSTNISKPISSTSFIIRLASVQAGMRSKVPDQTCLSNCAAAIDFFNKVAELAESEGHHPDLHLESYREVKVSPVPGNLPVTSMTQCHFPLDIRSSLQQGCIQAHAHLIMADVRPSVAAFFTGSSWHCLQLQRFRSCDCQPPSSTIWGCDGGHRNVLAASV